MNRLANESSPYLQQHASNPVDWFPWGEEAFLKAKEEDRPILLSVGYSACHWCHVMAHESFEDDATAKVMNDLFVNVKVDREERPDVDAIYMEATQAMTGQGGWPMTVFMTPDGRPFFAGTYFPKQSFAGRPSFTELLHAVDEAWRNQRDDLNGQADQLSQAIASRTHAEPSDTDIYAHGQEWLRHAQAALHASYDKEWGGFGQAPKFPQTGALELLLAEGSEDSIAMVRNTLDAMASGGIYDHLGGGFSRYSVDSFWMVPHFEKMLYDQAALVRVLVRTFQVTGEQRYRQIAEETIDYVLRDLRSEQGGFFSAEDADSEGEEGKFYVWRPEEIDAAIGNESIAEAAKKWWGVTPAGNFEGSNILHRPERGDLIRPEQIEEARARLFEARTHRVRPGLDDKVLTEWNAMFIAALAEAGPAFDRSDYTEAASEAADFLLQELRDGRGRWHRAWQESTGAKQFGFANDYAWIVEAFTRLGEATGEAFWREEARSTADAMIKLFWDDDNGGIFTVGSDAEQLILRSKDLFDGATASANSTAAVALVRLAALTEYADYRECAKEVLQLVAEPMSNHPTAFTNYLAAVDILTGDATETVVVGDHRDIVEAVLHHYLPRNVLLWGEKDESPLWEGRSDGAYVCRNQTCGTPANTPEETLDQLRSVLPS